MPPLVLTQSIINFESKIILNGKFRIRLDIQNQIELNWIKTNEDVVCDRTDFVEANPLKTRNKEKLKNFLYSREGKMYTPIIPVRKKLLCRSATLRLALQYYLILHSLLSTQLSKTPAEANWHPIRTDGATWTWIEVNMLVMMVK